MKRILEVSPEELEDPKTRDQLLEEVHKRLKTRRKLRETKQQKEMFDPSKPTKGKTK